MYCITIVKKIWDIHGEESYWAMEHNLPIPPHEGLSILAGDLDPIKIEYLFVTCDGRVIAEIESEDWRPEKGWCRETHGITWEEQFEYTTAGFERIEGIHHLYKHDIKSLTSRPL